MTLELNFQETRNVEYLSKAPKPSAITMHNNTNTGKTLSLALGEARG